MTFNQSHAIAALRQLCVCFYPKSPWGARTSPQAVPLTPRHFGVWPGDTLGLPGASKILGPRPATPRKPGLADTHLYSSCEGPVGKMGTSSKAGYGCPGGKQEHLR